MMLSTIDIALRGATVALLLVLAASLFRGFGNVLAGRLAAAFALGSAAHAVTCVDRGDVAGRGSACARDRAVDRQCRGVLAVHAGAVRRDVQAALVARADLGGGRGFQFRQLHVAGAGIRCAVVHYRGQSAGAGLYRPGGRADDRVLVVGSGRAPPSRPRLHRQRGGAIWRPERGAADIAVRRRWGRDRQHREFGARWPPWSSRSRLR